MKYIDEDGKLRMLIAEKHLFKGVENYFIDSLLYQDSLETDDRDGTSTWKCMFYKISVIVYAC